MRLTSSLRATLLTGVLASLPAVLSAQSVSTDYDHHVNFENFHTFSFAKVHTDDPLYEQRLRDDIAQDLQKHGLQMVPSGGDLAVTAIGGVHDQKEYSSFYSGLGPGFGWGGWGGWWGGGWGAGGPGINDTTQREIPIGTLMVDLYSTQSQNLVFRGRSQAELHQHSEKNIKLVQKTVDKMFDHFPPKGKS